MNRDKRITVKIASIRTFNTAKALKMVSNQAVNDTLENENTKFSTKYFYTYVYIFLSACFSASSNLLHFTY